MNSILETLPPKERDIFKQVISLYDEKKYKKALKHIERLLETNPNFPGALSRIPRDAGVAPPVPLRGAGARGVPQDREGGGFRRRC